QTLLALAQRGAPLPESAHAVLARAIQGLSRLVGRVRARDEFSGDDRLETQAIENELESLRYEVVGGGNVDAETVAAETALRDDEYPIPPEGAAATAAVTEAPSIDAAVTVEATP